jgi:hypothetical protein
MYGHELDTYGHCLDIFDPSLNMSSHGLDMYGPSLDTSGMGDCQQEFPKCSLCGAPAVGGLDVNNSLHRA